MNTEEVIRALQLMENVESIVATYEPGEVRSNMTVRELKEACRVAIDAILAQQSRTLDQSRWKGCKMCTAKYTRKDWNTDGIGCHEFRVSGDSLMYCDQFYGWEGIRIKYCPNCGRPLTEEAWAELERRIGGNDGTVD